MRIGQGFDIHALVPDRRLVIGGVHIPHELGLAGHSDADVLLHALVDALLGAAALGNIGQHFPDNDVRYANVDSRFLLRESANLVARAGYGLVNVDATVIAQEPRLMPYIAQMQNLIAADLAVSVNRISVKAKTAEHLGALGRSEGIAALVVVLLDEVVTA
jgi:2-C-methyl-D-erythritol 2,4-cyclodiphosphate synthase